MAIKFKLKRGTSTPTTSDLDNGEVGVDTQAKIIYINDSGTVKALGSDLSNVGQAILPSATQTHNLGSGTKKWNQIFAETLFVGATVNATGGQFSSDIHASQGKFSAEVTCDDVLPNANNSFKIGTSTNKWSEVHATTYYGSGANLTNLTVDWTTVNNNLLPDVDAARDIGSPSKRFERVYGEEFYGDGSNLTGLAKTGTNTFTGNQTISNGDPKLILNDTTAGTSYSLYSDGGNFRIFNESSGGGIRFTVTSNGSVFTANNLDVSGSISLSGTVDGVDIAALNTTVANITPGIASLVNDSTPQLGGDLDTNGREIFMDHDKSIKFKNSSNTNCGNIEYKSGDFHITNAQGHILINNVATAGQVKINTENNFEVDVNTNDPAIIAKPNGAVELYNNGNLKFNTTTGGVEVTGTATVSSTFTAQGTSYLNGNVNLGNSNSDDILFYGSLDTDIIPKTDNTRKLGTSSYRFSHVYANSFYGDGSNLTGINSDLVNDTSPQLGGDLDMNSKSISSGILGIKNTGTQSELRLYCESNNAHYAAIKAPPHAQFSGNPVFQLPPNGGTNGYFLTTNGSGVTSWSAVSTDLSSDTSPTLGGDLDMDGNSISSGILGIKNTGSQSELRLYCESNNAHFVAIKAPPHSQFSGNQTFQLPPNGGTSGYVLSTDGNGVTSWVAQSSGGGGNASVAGSSTQIQYNLNGALAGSSNLTFDGTNLTVGGTISATSSSSSVAGHRKITTSTNAPSGGSDGDLWIQHN